MDTRFTERNPTGGTRQMLEFLLVLWEAPLLPQGKGPSSRQGPAALSV